MKRYIKKPIPVEAMEFDGTLQSFNAIWGWIVSAGQPAGTVDFRRDVLYVLTLQGVVPAKAGDWIIRGTHDFYPCNGTVFRETYVEVIPE